MENFFEKTVEVNNGIEVEEKIPETLPAVTVDNNVTWINEEFELPFKIEKGKPTELGLFFTPDPKEEKIKNIEVMRRHNRSGILGRVIFKDAQGRLYRDVDLKGIGFVSTFPGSKGIIVRPPEKMKNYQTRGIADKYDVENDKGVTEQFLQEGVRTYRIIAITELKEIIDKFGDKISIDTAKKTGLIKKDDEPVVEIRAFGTRTRIADLIRATPQEKEGFIGDAMKLVAQERNIEQTSFSKEDYLSWFVETMAVNVARMHNKNFVHGYLTDHNITLDARIVDLDSVETMDEINERKARGETPKKSFDNDVASLEVMISFLKGVLGLGKEIQSPEESIDTSHNLYVDEDIQEKIGKVYQEERKRLEGKK